MFAAAQATGLKRWKTASRRIERPPPSELHPEEFGLHPSDAVVVNKWKLAKTKVLTQARAEGGDRPGPSGPSASPEPHVGSRISRSPGPDGRAALSRASGNPALSRLSGNRGGRTSPTNPGGAQASRSPTRESDPQDRVGGGTSEYGSAQGSETTGATGSSPLPGGSPVVRQPSRDGLPPPGGQWDQGQGVPGDRNSFQLSAPTPYATTPGLTPGHSAPASQRPSQVGEESAPPEQYEEAPAGARKKKSMGRKVKGMFRRLTGRSSKTPEVVPEVDSRDASRNVLEMDDADRKYRGENADQSLVTSVLKRLDTAVRLCALEPKRATNDFTPDDLLMILAILGYTVIQYDLEMYMELSEVGIKELYSYTEVVEIFLELMDRNQAIQQKDRILMDAAFSYFDQDGNGNIDLNELSKAYQELGAVLTDADMDSLETVVDQHKGRLSIEDFRRMAEGLDLAEDFISRATAMAKAREQARREARERQRMTSDFGTPPRRAEAAGAQAAPARDSFFSLAANLGNVTGISGMAKWGFSKLERVSGKGRRKMDRSQSPAGPPGRTPSPKGGRMMRKASTVGDKAAKQPFQMRKANTVGDVSDKTALDRLSQRVGDQDAGGGRGALQAAGSSSRPPPVPQQQQQQAAQPGLSRSRTIGNSGPNVQQQGAAPQAGGRKARDSAGSLGRAISAETEYLTVLATIPSQAELGEIAPVAMQRPRRPMGVPGTHYEEEEDPDDRRGRKSSASGGGAADDVGLPRYSASGGRGSSNPGTKSPSRLSGIFGGFGSPARSGMEPSESPAGSQRDRGALARVSRRLFGGKSNSAGRDDGARLSESAANPGAGKLDRPSIFGRFMRTVSGRPINRTVSGRPTEESRPEVRTRDFTSSLFGGIGAIGRGLGAGIGAIGRGLEQTLSLNRSGSPILAGDSRPESEIQMQDEFQMSLLEGSFSNRLAGSVHNPFSGTFQKPGEDLLKESGMVHHHPRQWRMGGGQSNATVTLSPLGTLMGATKTLKRVVSDVRHALNPSPHARQKRRDMLTASRTVGTLDISMLAAMERQPADGSPSRLSEPADPTGAGEQPVPRSSDGRPRVGKFSSFLRGMRLISKGSRKESSGHGASSRGSDPSPRGQASGGPMTSQGGRATGATASIPEGEGEGDEAPNAIRPATGHLKPTHRLKHMQAGDGPGGSPRLRADRPDSRTSSASTSVQPRPLSLAQAQASFVITPAGADATTPSLLGPGGGANASSGVAPMAFPLFGEPSVSDDRTASASPGPGGSEFASARESFVASTNASSPGVGRQGLRTRQQTNPPLVSGPGPLPEGPSSSSGVRLALGPGVAPERLAEALRDAFVSSPQRSMRSPRGSVLGKGAPDAAPESPGSSGDGGKLNGVQRLLGMPHAPRTSDKLGGQPWSEEEHCAFLAGLTALGRGNWRSISKMFVPSRTPTQVASHAQKYALRTNGVTKRRSRFTHIERTFAVTGATGASLSTSSAPSGPRGLGDAPRFNSFNSLPAGLVPSPATSDDSAGRGSVLSGAAAPRLPAPPRPVPLQATLHCPKLAALTLQLMSRSEGADSLFSPSATSAFEPVALSLRAAEAMDA